MLRKLRRVKRRSTVTKRNNRRRSFRRRTKSEVKHFTVYTSAPIAAKTQVYGAASRTLRNTTITGNDVTYTRGLISRIQPGVSNGQRVGSSIYGKFISFKMLLWLCPASTDTGTYTTTSVRIIVHNSPGYNGGSDISNFFDADTIIPIMNRPERANFNIYYDKVITLNAPIYIDGPTRAGKGVMRKLDFRLPLGRQIEFSEPVGTGTSQVKKDRDIYTLSIFAYSPSVADDVQIACISYSIRTYYTDP